MGYYLNRDQRFAPLPTKGKAHQLILNGAELIKHLTWEGVPADKALICVVQNGVFDAAAFCYSKGEMEAFLDTREGEDWRPRTWLLVDKAWAERESGYGG